MNPALDIETIAPEALLAKTQALRAQGYRLVQIGATRLAEGVELTYSFDLHGCLISLRVQLPPAKAQVPSITSAYWAAFLYENELHDLFNVHVDGIAVDFHGALYKTAIKFPFGSTKVPQIKPQTGGARSPSAPVAMAGKPQPTAPVPAQRAASGDVAPLPGDSRN